MGERIRRMDAKQVETILKRYGFRMVSQKGSHRKWRNDERNLQVLCRIAKVEIYFWGHSEG